MEKEVKIEKNQKIENQSMEKSDGTKNEKRFKLTEDGKKEILNILKKKPFKVVVNYVSLLSKEELTESEANELINFIGSFAYEDVAEFFANIQSYFTHSE